MCKASAPMATQAKAKWTLVKPNPNTYQPATLAMPDETMRTEEPTSTGSRPAAASAPATRPPGG